MHCLWDSRNNTINKGDVKLNSSAWQIFRHERNCRIINAYLIIRLLLLAACRGFGYTWIQIYKSHYILYNFAGWTFHDTSFFMYNLPIVQRLLDFEFQRSNDPKLNLWNARRKRIRMKYSLTGVDQLPFIPRNKWNVSGNDFPGNERLIIFSIKNYVCHFDLLRCLFLSYKGKRRGVRRIWRWAGETEGWVREAKGGIRGWKQIWGPERISSLFLTYLIFY